MNDALCPLSRNVVSANAARPGGAGSAGMKTGRSASIAAMRDPPSVKTMLLRAWAGRSRVVDHVFPGRRVSNSLRGASPRDDQHEARRGLVVKVDEIAAVGLGVRPRD